MLAQLTPGLDNLAIIDGRLFVSNFTGEITEILTGGETRTVLAGGSLDGVTQVVGPFAVPQKGARLQLSLREPRGFYQILNPIFKP